MMNRLLLEKRSAAALCGWVALLIGVLFVEGCHAQEDADADADAERPPNIVFILSDDVGYGDLSCYGHPYSETPNLDRLASEGTKYTQFNVNGNVCPHTRAGFMTGRSPSFFPNYTAKYGFMGAVTITQLLKEAGYATGHIGKWNIGGDPERDAVDYGIDDLRRTSDLDGDPRGREGLRFDDAIDFVEQNADVPFYLNLWIHATHTPVEAPQDMVDRYQDLEIDRSDFSFWMQDRFDVVEARNGSIDENMHLYMADLHAMDLNVGRLLDTIDDLNLTDSTIVVFTRYVWQNLGFLCVSQCFPILCLFVPHNISSSSHFLFVCSVTMDPRDPATASPVWDTPVACGKGSISTTKGAFVFPLLSVGPTIHPREKSTIP
jgi:hypothetical protein